jgi:hypothetical protein
MQQSVKTQYALINAQSPFTQSQREDIIIAKTLRIQLQNAIEADNNSDTQLDSKHKDQYVVHKFIDHEQVDGKWMLNVVWKGFSAKHNTLEVFDNLVHCVAAVQLYINSIDPVSIRRKQAYDDVLHKEADMVREKRENAANVAKKSRRARTKWSAKQNARLYGVTVKDVKKRTDAYVRAEEKMSSAFRARQEEEQEIKYAEYEANQVRKAAIKEIKRNAWEAEEGLDESLTANS